ncbi:MAG: HD-GYP domain-containing protein [Coriobacteriia bacterium]
MTPRFRAFVAVIWVALGVALIVTPRAPIHLDPWIVAFLLLTGFLADSFAFQVPSGGSVSLAFGVVVCGMLYGGPFLGAAVAAVCGVTPQDIRQKKPLSVLLFNVGQLSLSALLGASTLSLLAQVPWAGVPTGQIATAGRLFAALTGAAAFYAANVVMMAVGFSVAESARPRDVVRRLRVSDYFVSFAALALFGILLAQLTLVAGVPGALLLVVPFLAARQTFRVYSELTDAFTDTVRSLVAAIEAKDPYTKGHSERVAAYSRDIAQAIGLSGSQIDRVEMAALLHDVGKIGISSAVLSKDSALSRGELQTIKEHPETGRQILDSVDFVADLAPIVVAHHERLDGTGYPAGVTAHHIPLEARILAVADAYDAMSSSRPYREALAPTAVIVEMRTVSGTQLDGNLVECLLGLVGSEIQ